jgi:NitT/TauT family transport system substrate-binding protein
MAWALAAVGAAASLAGCGDNKGTSPQAGPKGGLSGQASAPAFTLAWSEYPSWSVFGVASELGLIDGRKGHMGALEKKWGVDIVLELLEYDPCIQLYASGKCDAVCATNIDILAPAATRTSVAIMPTSTSVGADACLVVFDVADKKKALEELKKVKVFGLAKSVSEYAFDRNLELLGEDPKKYQFTDEPPNTAALAMQSRKEDHKAIMVWNPFVLQVLKDNKDARRLFDSSTIPEEIIDMVVVGADSLKKERGPEFASCVLDVYYEMNKALQDPDQAKADKVLIKLGEKFSKLGLEDMRICVKETRFYKSPDEGLKLFTGDKLPNVMKTVSQFCVTKDMVKTAPKYAFGPPKTGEDVQLRFDPSYMQKIRDQK